jgi:hypothetical protein
MLVNDSLFLSIHTVQDATHMIPLATQVAPSLA